MKLLTKFLIALAAFLLIGNVNAASCSFKTQLKFLDGSLGCVEDLPISSVVLIGNRSPLLEVVNKNLFYAVARAKNTNCKGNAVATGDFLHSARPSRDIVDKKALDLCMNQGCDCELIISEGYALVDKESLISGRYLDSSSQAIANQVIAEEKKIQQEQAKKTQIEKEQKDLAANIKLEKENAIAEEKRIQAELAKNNQDKIVAEKIRVDQEKRLLEEAKLQAQAALLQVQEQEKTNEIARLQQLKEGKEKALFAQKADEERIAALRKELEQEIRASIKKEMILSQPRDSQIAVTPKLFANRRALVIGNDSYQRVATLSNAREDARAIAESLALLGYKVSLKLDVTEKQFKSELRTFKSQVQPGDEVAIYYAGHGVQIASTNYLLPIDIAGQNEEEIKDEGISLQRLLDDMSEKNAKLTLAMIDACRDNPFKGTGRGGIGARGLAPTTAATGQMIVFSAGSGQQAMDRLGPNDKSKNGLFTRVLVKEMQKGGISVDRVIRNVRSEVVALAKSVGHDQVPAIYDQVVGEFYFKQ